MATRLTARQRRQNRNAPSSAQLGIATNYVARLARTAGADAPRQLRAALRAAPARSALGGAGDQRAVRLAARTSGIEVPTPGLR